MRPVAPRGCALRKSRFDAVRPVRPVRPGRMCAPWYLRLQNRKNIYIFVYICSLIPLFLGYFRLLFRFLDFRFSSSVFAFVCGAHGAHGAHRSNARFHNGARLGAYGRTALMLHLRVFALIRSCAPGWICECVRGARGARGAPL